MEGVSSAQDVIAIDVEVDSDIDVSLDEGNNDGWDVRDDQIDGTAGVKVSVLARVQGVFGLTSWGKLGPQIIRDKIQKLLSLISASLLKFHQNNSMTR